MYNWWLTLNLIYSSKLFLHIWCIWQQILKALKTAKIIVKIISKIDYKRVSNPRLIDYIYLKILSSKDSIILFKIRSDADWVDAVNETLYNKSRD